MASSEAFEVVLAGGGPWGFRLQGGKEFRAPLKIAKVTQGSKADKAGITEGLVVRSINNNSCEGWTHSDALNCIKKSGMVLELVLSKQAEKPPSSNPGRPYSYTTDDMVSGPKESVPPQYKEVSSFVTLPRGQQWVDTDSWKGSQNDDKDSAFSSPGAQASFGSSEWNPEIISSAMRTPDPIKLVPSSEVFRPSNQNTVAAQVKAPENVRGFVDKPRPIGRGGRRFDGSTNEVEGVDGPLHTESTGSDDEYNNNLPNGETNAGDGSASSRPALSHLRNKKEEAAFEATRDPRPVPKVPPPTQVKPTRRPSQENRLSDSEAPGPHRPAIKRGGKWYKELFKEMHSTAGNASNLSALLANDAMKKTPREADGAASSSPRSGSPSVEHADNDVFHKNHDEPAIRAAYSASVSSEPRSSTSSGGSGERKASRSGHVPAWYRDLQRGADVPVQKIEEPGSYVVTHRKQPSLDSSSRTQTSAVHVVPGRASLGSSGGYIGARKASSPAALVQTVQMEQRNQPPTATSLYESRFQRRASEQVPAASSQPPSADYVIKLHEEEARKLREEAEWRRKEEERRNAEEERRKREAERRKREEEEAALQRVLEEERRMQQEEAERQRKLQEEQEEAARRAAAAQKPQFIAKALYTFKPQSPQELQFRKGAEIPVTRQIDKNWIEGMLDGKKGIFPRNYVELMPYEEEEEEVVEVTPPAPILVEGEARMKYTFKAESGRELACNKGDIMSLIRRVDENWYEARIGDTRGIVPVKYVEVFREPELVSPAAIRQEPVVTRTETRRPEEVMDKRRSAGYEQMPPIPRPSEPSPREPPKEVARNSFPVYSQPGPMTQARYMPEPEPGPEPEPEPLSGSAHIMDDPMAMWNLQGERFRAVFSFTPTNEDELALAEGDEVLVLEKCDDGWFVGTSSRTNMFGTFPGNYVKPA